MRRTIDVYATQLPSAPEIKQGHQRKWFKCPECGEFQYYDYVPYSLSTPILTSLCGHGTGRKLHDFMIHVNVVVPTQAQAFRNWANSEYTGFIKNSGLIDMTDKRREETLERFPSIQWCASHKGVVTAEWSDIERVTEQAIVHSIIHTVTCLLLEQLHHNNPESCHPDKFRGEELVNCQMDHAGDVMGSIIMKYEDSLPIHFHVNFDLDVFGDDDRLQSFIEGLLPGPKMFEIEQYELHVATYHIEANSRDEALAILMTESGSPNMIQTDYLEVDRSKGMAIKNLHPDEIQNLEARLKRPPFRDVIHGIKSIKRIES